MKTVEIFLQWSQDNSKYIIIHTLHNTLSAILLNPLIIQKRKKKSLCKYAILSERVLNGDSNPDLCNVGAVLYQLSYSTARNYWTMCTRQNLIFAERVYRVHDLYQLPTRSRSLRELILSPYTIDVEIGDDNTRICIFWMLPLSLLLKQHKNAMIRFIYSTPYFKNTT